MHHHPIRISARVPGALADRAPANSLPPIPADRLRAIFETHVVDDRPDLFEQLREGGSTPARPLVILIGAACSWLAVFCVAYFAAELIRGLVR